MVKIAIIYHSGFGHTKVQAENVAIGANSVSGADVTLYTVTDILDNIEKLNDYDAMIFGSPTYMGSVSAELKTFMEKSSKLWAQRKWQDKIAAGFTNSHALSGDKLNSLIQINIFAMQHGMIWVGVGDLDQAPDGNPADENAINRMGSFLGAMAQSENASPEVTPPSGDLKTAQLLGVRVANISLKLKS